MIMSSSSRLSSNNSMTSKIINFVQSFIDTILQTLGFTNKSGTILLLGLDNAGKTTLLHRLRTQGHLMQFPPTDRPNLESFQIAGINFVGWDLGGHEAVRHLWDDYIPEVNALVFLIDATDYSRFEEVKDELDNLVHLIPRSDVDDENDTTMGDEEDYGNSSYTRNGKSNDNSIPVAILLNKCDLNEALESRDIARAIGYEEIVQYHGEDNIGIFRTSVWRGEGYEEAFRWISEFL